MPNSEIAKFNSELMHNVELDNHYLKYHSDKARRLEERGSKCYHTTPEAMDAAIELLEEL